MSVDGTVWELLKNIGANNNARGAFIATPVNPCVVTNLQPCPAWNAPAGYNFTKLDGSCPNAKCPSQVVFAVDEQTGISATDYNVNVLPYLSATLDGFLISGTTFPNASFAFAWPNQDGNSVAWSALVESARSWVFDE